MLVNSHSPPRASLRFKHKKEEALETRMDNFTCMKDLLSVS